MPRPAEDTPLPPPVPCTVCGRPTRATITAPVGGQLVEEACCLICQSSEEE